MKLTNKKHHTNDLNIPSRVAFVDRSFYPFSFLQNFVDTSTRSHNLEHKGINKVKGKVENQIHVF